MLFWDKCNSIQFSESDTTSIVLLYQLSPLSSAKLHKVQYKPESHSVQNCKKIYIALYHYKELVYILYLHCKKHLPLFEINDEL